MIVVGYFINITWDRIIEFQQILLIIQLGNLNAYTLRFIHSLDEQSKYKIKA